MNLGQCAPLHQVYHPKEHDLRSANYQQTLVEIAEINARATTWTAGINEYSDMSWEEFAAMYTVQAPQDCSATATSYKVSGWGTRGANPEEVDWRTKGVVTDVKNQGQCGSCWTFSTTGAVESAHAISTRELPILSEQQLIDCAGAFDDHGCSGGLPSHAFQYIMANGGLDTEAAYSYEAKDGMCVICVCVLACV
jgi:cathepsin H